MERTMQQLKSMQAAPLDVKVLLTKQRIREWVNEFGTDGVYVSFSGGKDSTVLLHIVREMYPSIPAVFCDTGLEYPEIREFVRTFENVEWLKPKMTFREVIEKEGYPIISKDIAQAVFDVTTQARIMNCDKRETKLYKRVFDPTSYYAQRYPQYVRTRYDYLLDAPFKISHRCCDIIKKNPCKNYEKQTGRKPILAVMANESRLRLTQWRSYGCNAFNSKRPISKPMSFWTDQDVLNYIRVNNLPICPIYGDILEVGEVKGQMNISDYAGVGCYVPTLETTQAKRTGCMFCMFGCSQKSWDNFERMKKTHPKQYEWIMKDWDAGGLGYKRVIDWLNENGNLHIRY